MTELSNPNWYCKEVEARAYRDLGRFEVGCDCCGFKSYTFDRRWPKEDYVKFLQERCCTCD